MLFLCSMQQDDLHWVHLFAFPLLASVECALAEFGVERPHTNTHKVYTYTDICRTCYKQIHSFSPTSDEYLSSIISIISITCMFSQVQCWDSTQPSWYTFDFTFPKGWRALHTYLHVQTQTPQKMGGKNDRNVLHKTELGGDCPTWRWLSYVKPLKSFIFYLFSNLCCILSNPKFVQ